LHISKPAPNQHPLQQPAGGQKPNIVHHGVAVFGHQNLKLVPFYHQGFKNQEAVRLERVPHQLEMLDGTLSVIQHAHGESDIENTKIVSYGLVPNRQHIIRIGAQKMAKGRSLKDVEKIRV